METGMKNEQETKQENKSPIPESTPENIRGLIYFLEKQNLRDNDTAQALDALAIGSIDGLTRALEEKSEDEFRTAGLSDESRSKMFNAIRADKLRKVFAPDDPSTFVLDEGLDGSYDLSLVPASHTSLDVMSSQENESRANPNKKSGKGNLENINSSLEPAPKEILSWPPDKAMEKEVVPEVSHETVQGLIYFLQKVGLRDEPTATALDTLKIGSIDGLAHALEHTSEEELKAAGLNDLRRRKLSDAIREDRLRREAPVTDPASFVLEENLDGSYDLDLVPAYHKSLDDVNTQVRVPGAGDYNGNGSQETGGDAGVSLDDAAAEIGPDLLSFLEKLGLADDQTLGALGALQIGSVGALTQALDDFSDKKFRSAGLNDLRRRKLLAALRPETVFADPLASAVDLDKPRELDNLDVNLDGRTEGGNDSLGGSGAGSGSLGAEKAAFQERMKKTKEAEARKAAKASEAEAAGGDGAAATTSDDWAMHRRQVIQDANARHESRGDDPGKLITGAASADAGGADSTATAGQEQSGGKTEAEAEAGTEAEAEAGPPRTGSPPGAPTPSRKKPPPRSTSARGSPRPASTSSSKRPTPSKRKETPSYMRATGASKANSDTDKERVAAARIKAKKPAADLGKVKSKKASGDGASTTSGSPTPLSKPKPERPKRERGNFMSATGASKASLKANEGKAAAAREKTNKPAKEIGKLSKNKTGDGEVSTTADSFATSSNKPKPERPKRERGNFMSATGASKANAEANEAKVTAAKEKTSKPAAEIGNYTSVGKSDGKSRGEIDTGTAFEQRLAHKHEVIEASKAKAAAKNETNPQEGHGETDEEKEQETGEVAEPALPRAENNNSQLKSSLNANFT